MPRYNNANLYHNPYGSYLLFYCFVVRFLLLFQCVRSLTDCQLSADSSPLWSWSSALLHTQLPHHCSRWFNTFLLFHSRTVYHDFWSYSVLNAPWNVVKYNTWDNKYLSENKIKDLKKYSKTIYIYKKRTAFVTVHSPCDACQFVLGGNTVS